MGSAVLDISGSITLVTVWVCKLWPKFVGKTWSKWCLFKVSIIWYCLRVNDVFIALDKRFIDSPPRPLGGRVMHLSRVEWDDTVIIAHTKGGIEWYSKLDSTYFKAVSSWWSLRLRSVQVELRGSEVLVMAVLCGLCFRLMREVNAFGCFAMATRARGLPCSQSCAKMSIFTTS